MMRPRPARWFEALVARADCAMLLEALAATGSIELETHSVAALPPYFEEVRPLLQQFSDFARRYRHYWPTSGLRPSAVHDAPGKILADVLERLRAWASEAEPTIQRLQLLEAERAELALWRTLLDAIAGTTLGFSRLAAAGPLLGTAVLELPKDAEPHFLPSALMLRVEQAQSVFFIIVASAADLEAISAQVTALKGRVHSIAPWLKDDPGQNQTYIQARMDEIEREAKAAASRIEESHHTHGLRILFGDAKRLEWMIDNVHALDGGEHFVRVTGWTSDFAGTALAAAIDHCGARALLYFPAAPDNAQAPLLFMNPAWSRPFELFTRALGMPAASETDPTQVLAVVVPLMFGYMFGDIGQGLIIATIAWFLRRRYAVARLLLSCGIAATGFGWMFGSIFSMHGFIKPLWLAPLDDPITILWVPIAGGAAFLTLGLAMNAVAAYWRGESIRWLAHDSGILPVYFGLLGALASPAAIWIAAAGIAACLAGPAIQTRSAAAILPAAGRLIERVLQLLINTLSFARVGAFALAHAGLSSAIVSLVDAAPNPALKALLLVLGNALVLTLEVMVVSIQTTRLVLFEFFTRFFTGEGRAFRPLPAPPLLSQVKI
ncbi:V-type ATPase 116kDa subunit family protein [Noviherbaspirillum sedimenti]|uniref:ATPase n=1 Tax=Noviherbaspirillum sedimenti TaxID=2320865 RepID=A0A3A3G0F3_9BURK|nr:V-type ATPase 116kDa subunit family protein [Noviherbaspirillum sedimenti]RJG00389.1 ATPase [Noviherbaspirillum sedimenti]